MGEQPSLSAGEGGKGAVGGWVGEQPSLSAGEGGKGVVGVWVKQSLQSALSNEERLRYIAPVLCSLFIHCSSIYCASFL